MPLTSHVEVTLSLLVTVETESHPGDILDELFKDILADVVQDQLKQYQQKDVRAVITDFKVVDTEENDLTDEEKWPIEDWRYDVANGDTKLGYAEWVKHNKESEEG